MLFLILTAALNAHEICFMNNSCEISFNDPKKLIKEAEKHHGFVKIIVSEDLYIPKSMKIRFKANQVHFVGNLRKPKISIKFRKNIISKHSMILFTNVTVILNEEIEFSRLEYHVKFDSGSTYEIKKHEHLPEVKIKSSEKQKAQMSSIGPNGSGYENVAVLFNGPNDYYRSIFPADNGSETVVIDFNGPDVDVIIDGDTITFHFDGYRFIYNVLKRIYGNRYPQITFTCKGYRQQFSISQTKAYSPLNLSFKADYIYLEGDNPITVFGWNAFFGLRNLATVDIRTPVPNLIIMPNSATFYFYDDEAQFESIFFSSNSILNYKADQDLVLKLKSIIYGDQSELSRFNGNRIFLEVDFIHFFCRSRAIFDQSIIVHKYIKSEKYCVVNFRNITIANNDFYISIMDEYGSDSGLCIEVNNGDIFIPPPSNVVHVLVSSKFLYLSEFVFAQIDNDNIHFDLIYDDKSANGLKSTCSIVSLSNQNGAHTIKFDDVKQQVTYIYGSPNESDLLDDKNNIYVDTLDSNKWSDKIHSCVTYLVTINISSNKRDTLNLDILKKLKRQISVIIIGIGKIIDLDLSSECISHINFLSIQGDNFTIEKSNEIELGQNVILKIKGNVSFSDVAFKNIRRDNLKILHIDFENILQMGNEIVKGKKILINCNNNIYLDYSYDYVRATTNGKSVTISTTNTLCYLITHSYVCFTPKCDNPTNNFVVECGIAEIINDGNNIDNWFPVVDAQQIFCSDILPFIQEKEISEEKMKYQSVRINSSKNIKLNFPKDFSNIKIASLYYCFDFNTSVILEIQDNFTIPYIKFNKTKSILRYNNIVSHMTLSGVDFHQILSGALDIHGYAKNPDPIGPTTTQDSRKREGIVSRFPGLKTKKITLSSGSYLELDENNQPEVIEFVFKANAFPPLLDSISNHSKAQFIFRYLNPEEGTYDKYDFYFNQFVPIAFFRSSSCSDLNFTRVETENMKIKCENAWLGGGEVGYYDDHATFFANLSANFIKTPDFNANANSQEESSMKKSLKFDAIIGAVVGCLVVVIIIIVIIVIIVIRKKKNVESSDVGEKGGVTL